MHIVYDMNDGLTHNIIIIMKIALDVKHLIPTMDFSEQRLINYYIQTQVNMQQNVCINIFFSCCITTLLLSILLVALSLKTKERNNVYTKRKYLLLLLLL